MIAEGGKSELQVKKKIFFMVIFLDSPERLLQKAFGFDLDNGKQNPINKIVKIRFTFISSQLSEWEWELNCTQTI